MSGIPDPTFTRLRNFIDEIDKQHRIEDLHPREIREAKINAVVNNLLEVIGEKKSLTKKEIMKAFDDHGFQLNLDKKKLRLLKNRINTISVSRGITIEKRRGVSFEDKRGGAFKRRIKSDRKLVEKAAVERSKSAHNLLKKNYNRIGTVELKTRYRVKTNTPQMKQLEKYQIKPKKIKEKTKETLKKAPIYKGFYSTLMSSIIGTEKQIQGKEDTFSETKKLVAYTKSEQYKEIEIKRGLLQKARTNLNKQDEVNESIEKKKGKLNALSESIEESWKVPEETKVKETDEFNELNEKIKKKNTKLARLERELNEIENELGLGEIDLELVKSYNNFYSKKCDIPKERTKEFRTEKQIAILKKEIPEGYGGKAFSLTIPKITSKGERGIVNGLFFNGKNSKGDEKPFSPLEKTVVFLSGSGDRAENYGAPLVEELQKEGYQTVLFNYMGFGDSTGELSEYSLYASAEGVLQYLTSELGLSILPENLYIHGYSLGGYVATEMAVNHPDLGGVVIDRSYTSGLAVANKEEGKKGIMFMKYNFGKLDTEKKLRRCEPKLMIFDDEDELVKKEPNFGVKDREGKWVLKKKFRELENVTYHVIPDFEHLHLPTGIWFSEDQPETRPEPRETYFKFLGPPNAK